MERLDVELAQGRARVIAVASTARRAARAYWHSALAPGDGVGAAQPAQPQPAARRSGAPPRRPPRPGIDTLKRIRDTGAILIGVREAVGAVLVPRRAEAAAGLLGRPVPARRRGDQGRAPKLPRLEVKYVTVSSANRIPALLENKIDLECGSTTNTRDRQKQVAFAYTTFVAGIKMLAEGRCEHRPASRTCAARPSW